MVAWLLFFQSGLRIDLSRPAVVQRIQRLQRLETVVYSMEKIVTGTQDNAYLPKFLGGDRILLIVHGEVIAGIDLAKLDEVEDQHQGRPHRDRDAAGRDFFGADRQRADARSTAAKPACSRSPDPNLESEVRREAERQIRQSAIDGGILKTAADNGRANLAGLLEALGFESVVVR